MLFGRKGKVQVDIGDVASEKEHLTQFLKTTHKIEVTPVENKLVVEDEKVTTQEMQHILTKFIYKRNLNATHYATIQGNTVKIETFKGAEKKAKKPEKSVTHQTAAQSWGL